jgi:hypothetical protein
MAYPATCLVELKTPTADLARNLIVEVWDELWLVLVGPIEMSTRLAATSSASCDILRVRQKGRPDDMRRHRRKPHRYAESPGSASGTVMPGQTRKPDLGPDPEKPAGADERADIKIEQLTRPAQAVEQKNGPEPRRDGGTRADPVMPCGEACLMGTSRGLRAKGGISRRARDLSIASAPRGGVPSRLDTHRV